jgi:hypothetical protein
MFSIKSKYFRTAMLLVSLSLVMGCQKSNDNTSTIENRSPRGGSTNYPGQINPTTGQTVYSDAVYVKASTNSGSTDFQRVIQDLLAPQAVPEAIGSVDPNTGVLLRGFIDIDAQGNMITRNSKITIQVTDEYALKATSSSKVQPFTLTVPGVGGVLQNGAGRMSFADCSGRIEVQGSFTQDGSQFSGRVWFQNQRKTDCQSPLSSSTGMQILGDFTVSTCGFVRCQ